MGSKTSYSEQELVTLLQQQNQQAFGYLYDNYANALHGIIFSIVKENETASDVLQEVFMNIWKKIGSYDPGKGRLFTWMLNIARNAAIDKIRSREYRDNLKNVPISETQDMNIGSSQKAAVEDVGFKKILKKLKEEQRMLIELSYFQGYTHEEISKALNIPLGTVKTRIRSALTQLRTMLD